MHDELPPVAARWVDGNKEPLALFNDSTSRETAHMLEELLREAPNLPGIPKALQTRARSRVNVIAPVIVAALVNRNDIVNLFDAVNAQGSISRVNVAAMRSSRSPPYRQTSESINPSTRMGQVASEATTRS